MSGAIWERWNPGATLRTSLGAQSNASHLATVSKRETQDVKSKPGDISCHGDVTLWYSTNQRQRTEDQCLMPGVGLRCTPNLNRDLETRVQVPAIIVALNLLLSQRFQGDDDGRDLNPCLQISVEISCCLCDAGDATEVLCSGDIGLLRGKVVEPAVRNMDPKEQQELLERIQDTDEEEKYPLLFTFDFQEDMEEVFHNMAAEEDLRVNAMFLGRWVDSQ
ncbi:unnamed protein product [Boreogadus saida]